MKHLSWIWLAVMVSAVFSCRDQKPARRLHLRIIGLDKGTVYLKHFRGDTTLQLLDSAFVKGKKYIDFDLSHVEPQLLFLEVKERPGEYFMFFSDDTLMNVVTDLEKFGYAQRVEGGKNVAYWQKYMDMLRQYNGHKLDLTKERLEAYKDRDTAHLHRADNQLASLEKRRKLFALNFAMSPPFLPVKAYVAYTEFKDNPRALDTIYKVWPDALRQSKYGRMTARKLSARTSAK